MSIYLQLWAVCTVLMLLLCLLFVKIVTVEARCKDAFNKTQGLTKMLNDLIDRQNALEERHDKLVQALGMTYFVPPNPFYIKRGQFPVDEHQVQQS